MDINGSPLDTVNERMQVTRRFEQFVQYAMSQAVAMLPAGYKPTVIFSFAGHHERDIIVSAAKLDDVFKALVEKMKAAGIEVPKQIVDAPAAEMSQEDVRLAILNLVAAIRKSVPFITGPGADTAKKMLGQAVAVGSMSETARHVVAEYLSTVPGCVGMDVAHIERMLQAAEEGLGQAALVFHAGVAAGTVAS